MPSNMTRPVRKLATSAAGSLRKNLGKYPVGLQLHGYEIQAVNPIDELLIVAVKLKHLRTGSEHLHLDPSNDDNNVFLIGFKTNPPDATGVPHILEHTTLCGSTKYPVRDPFFKMLNRSLSNFMNAMTGHDYTFYPFATTNKKDFENLMDVYLLLVFEPLLSREDFTQEGWRLENTDPNDKQSPIIYKGVVFNEMKGQYSNLAYYFYIKFQESIYPSLNNSGGDPLRITDLHHEDLLDFHALNYHPLNAKTFTYGPLNLVTHLQTLNESFVPFGKRPPRGKASIKQPRQLSQNETVIVDGPFDSLTGKPISDQWKASITWKLGNPLAEEEQYNVFKWKLLSSLLCDGHNAPFYQELIEKRFGDDFSANTGLDNTTAMYSFTLGVDNINEEQVSQLDQKLTTIFKERVIPELKLKEKSSFHERIEAALHQIELSLKKHKPDFGLGLLNLILPSWVNGVDPLQSLKVEEIIETFKEDYGKNGLLIFEELIELSILNEKVPTFKFIMKPVEDFTENLAQAEQTKLQEKISQMTEEDKEITYIRGQELAKKHLAKEDVSVLPTLTMQDIATEGKFYELNFSSLNGGENRLQKRFVSSNGLVYMTAKRDVSHIPIKFYKYIPLLTSCLTNLAGTASTPITALETQIHRYTGGILFSCLVATDPYDVTKASLQFVVNGMSLKENSDHVYKLWKEILQETVWEPNEAVLDKLSTLIKSLGSNQMNSISERGHSYANSYSNAQLTPAKYLSDMFSGIEQVEFVMDLNRRLDAEGEEFLKTEVLPVLRELSELLVGGNTDSKFQYSLLGDQDAVIANEVSIEKFDSQICDQVNPLLVKLVDQQPSLSGLKSRFDEVNPNTFINLPFQIGFASMAKLGTSYVQKDGASLQVLSQLLSFKHLHSVIRESNGAYGGGLNYDGLGGTINYYSYRDPNPLKSVDSFKNSVQVALNETSGSDGGWNENDLQEAKLAIFQSIDAPSHISQQGAAYFLKGITDDMRQKRREDFLAVSIADLKDVAEKYLVKGADIATVIGNKNEVKDAAQLKEWQIKTLEV